MVMGESLSKDVLCSGTSYFTQFDTTREDYDVTPK